MGGRPGDDGLASVSFPYNVSDVSIEWSEMETPVLYEARKLIPDSGGAGEFRGGLGQELVFSAYRGRVKEGEPLVLSGSAGRIRFPPRGLAGGADGSYGAIEVNGEGIAPSSSPNVTVGDRPCSAMHPAWRCSRMTRRICSASMSFRTISPSRAFG